MDGVTLLIDCASLAYRAYHSVPPLRSPDGAPVHAALGLLNFVSKLIEDRRPSHLHVALDADWRPAFRVAALPSYKTHRLADDSAAEDEVGPQIAIAVELLEAAGISVASAVGFEAEDVIAALARRATGAVEIVTGDRDLYALVADPRVVVLYTLRGVSELAHVDQAYIARKYGIPGDRYLDFALLRGDPSDGLPGVRGIGEKTAALLISRYGSLEALLAAPDLAPGVRAKLDADAAYLAVARAVVAPVAECPVSAGDGVVPRAPRDGALLAALGVRHGLTASSTRLADVLLQRG